MQPTRSTPILLSFPLGFLVKDLLRLTHGAFAAGATTHRDGVLLLLSALAMGVVAVSSFALRRRLKRLEVWPR